MAFRQSDRRDALPKGTVLRGYTLEAVLGHGGFGIVYKARHNEVGHLVAIKEYLPAELAIRDGESVAPLSSACEEHYSEGLRRFRNEARALINLPSHPNVIACKDFFRSNGTAYFVMDFVDGQPLSEVLRSREVQGHPFEEVDLLGVAVPLTKGLAHVHRAGILHRDIKPANILIRQSDERPVLIDFGAAKQSFAEHTRSLAPYTEGYAALEQVGDGEVGTWTDLYGLGAVMWRIVAGGSPDAPSRDPVKVENRASSLVRGDADPLDSARRLGCGRFSGPVLAAIDACLALPHRQRLGDCSKLLDQLTAGGRSTPSEVTRRTDGRRAATETPQSVGHWNSSKGWLVVAAVTAVLAVVVAGLEFSSGRSGREDATGFWVHTKPPSASVNLVSSSETYRPGISLPPGRYEVEVSASGFVTRREWIEHQGASTSHEIALEPLAIGTTVLQPGDVSPMPRQDADPNEVELRSDSSTSRGGPPTTTIDRRQSREQPDTLGARGAPFNVLAQPPSATVTLLNTTERYRPGMMMPTGVYDVEVSAPGYETRRESIRHSIRSDKSYEIVLESIVAQVTDEPPAPLEQALEQTDRESTVLEEAWLRVKNSQSMEEIEDFVAVYANVPEAYGLVSIAKSRLTELQTERSEAKVTKSQLDSSAKEVVSQASTVAQPSIENPAIRLAMANFYLKGDGVPSDPVRAAEFFRQACDGGEMSGCVSLGGLYERGTGVARTPARAARLYRQACDGGEMSGCTKLGSLYQMAIGVTLDHARAAQLYRQACDGGEISGCASLGYLYHMGTGVTLNHARAVHFYGQACDGGEMRGCSNLGTLFYNGEGVKRNRPRAVELFRKACGGEFMLGCVNLGDSYFVGKGVKQNRSRAVELYQQACDRGEMAGCVNLGVAYFQTT